MDSKADLFLWKRLKSGDKTALATIYNQHIEALAQYGKRFSTDAQMVEDAIQDLFIHLWQQREKIGETDSILPYLLISLKRSLFKKLKVSGKTAEAEPEHYSFEATLSMEDILVAEDDQAERSAQLAAAFEQLSAKQREAIFLRFYQKMEYEDICQLLDINYQSVRNLISRSLQKLRKHMPLSVWALLTFFYFFSEILSTKAHFLTY